MELFRSKIKSQNHTTVKKKEKKVAKHWHLNQPMHILRVTESSPRLPETTFHSHTSDPFRALQGLSSLAVPELIFVHGCPGCYY